MNFIRSGFRIVRENPALIFAEIAWRWAFGAAAWILIIVTVRTILEGIDVSGAEIALARSNDAYLVADAIMRVLIQVLPRFAQALIILIPLLAVIWIVAATVGRMVTVTALFADGTSSHRSAGFQQAAGSPARAGFVRHGVQGPSASSRLFFPIAALHVLRAFFTVATFLAFFGTIFLVSSQFTPSLSPNMGPALIFGWMCLALLVAGFWGIVNWFLALAPIFIVHDQRGTWRSIADSLAFYRSNRTDYAAIASMFGLIRGAAMIVAVIAGVMTLAAGSTRAALVASIAVGLIYFAIADFLYIARLAAFVELAVAPATAPAVTAPMDPVSSTPPNLGLET